MSYLDKLWFVCGAMSIVSVVVFLLEECYQGCF